MATVAVAGAALFSDRRVVAYYGSVCSRAPGLVGQGLCFPVASTPVATVGLYMMC